MQILRNKIPDRRLENRVTDLAGIYSINSAYYAGTIYAMDGKDFAILTPEIYIREHIPDMERLLGLIEKSEKFMSEYPLFTGEVRDILEFYKFNTRGELIV